MSGRRLVDGRVVQGDEARRHRLTFRFARLLVLGSLFLGLALTNPANALFWKKVLPPEVHTEIFKLLESVKYKKSQSRRRNTSTSSSISSDTFSNYFLFSMKDDYTDIEIHAMGFSKKCSTMPSADPRYFCRGLRDFLQPKRRIQPQFSVRGEGGPMDDRSFLVYRTMLGIAVAGWFVTMSVSDAHALSDTGDVVFDSFLRLLLPNPETPLASTVTAILDVYLVHSASLDIMNDLISMQSKDSFFSFSSDKQTNFVFAVVIFYVTAASANVLVAKWNDRLFPSLGYSSDVLTACAMGYLGASASDATVILLDWRTTLTMILWMRTLYQFTAVTSISLSSVTLWCIAVCLGYLLGDYQVQNQLLVAFVNDMMHAADRLFSNLFGGFLR